VLDCESMARALDCAAWKLRTRPKPVTRPSTDPLNYRHLANPSWY
jgi:hypothetical protein